MPDDQTRFQELWQEFFDIEAEYGVPIEDVDVPWSKETMRNFPKEIQKRITINLIEQLEILLRENKRQLKEETSKEVIDFKKVQGLKAGMVEMPVHDRLGGNRIKSSDTAPDTQ